MKQKSLNHKTIQGFYLGNDGLTIPFFCLSGIELKQPTIEGFTQHHRWQIPDNTRKRYVIPRPIYREAE